MNMESLKLIRLSLIIILIIIIDLIIDSNCKPGGWSFKKLNLWGRSSKPSSSETSLESESDSSVKFAELCEYICKKEPEKGVKYCDCDSNDSLISSSPPSSSSSSEHNQISLSDYFKQETNPSMRQQMCSLICSEDSNEASKYCECDDSRTQGKSINSKQSMKSSGFQSLSDYFKSNNNGTDKTINSDENTRRQLCEYICSDEDPDEGKSYCDCNKIKQEQINLIAQQYHHNSNQQQRQENPNNNINGGVNNNFSIKNLLPVNHGHSREDICKLVCTIEPESDDGQCGCDDGQSENRFRWPWQSIRQWFG